MRAPPPPIPAINVDTKMCLRAQIRERRISIRYALPRFSFFTSGLVLSNFSPSLPLAISVCSSFASPLATKPLLLLGRESPSCGHVQIIFTRAHIYIYIYIYNHTCMLVYMRCVPHVVQVSGK